MIIKTQHVKKMIAMILKIAAPVGYFPVIVKIMASPFQG
jgi:hypothetical protein